MAITAQGLRAERGAFRLNVDDFFADETGTALVGRNGAGKSTLLLALQGIVPHQGVVTRPGRCAGVFAQPAVLRGSVLWNVEVIVRSASDVAARIARQRAERALASVGLADALGLAARRLSSGQRQRLALARALALEPQALFIDEPFANVDADGRPTLRGAVAAYAARSGCALVVATQSLADVAALCRHVILLERGSVREKVETHEASASRNPYLRALVAESRSTRLDDHSNGSAEVMRTPSGRASDAIPRNAVRTEGIP